MRRDACQHLLSAIALNFASLATLAAETPETLFIGGNSGSAEQVFTQANIHPQLASAWALLIAPTLLLLLVLKRFSGADRISAGRAS